MRELAKTPLHQWHAGHGGRMVDFAGWSMPVQYGSIVAEHQATRSAVGLFDVSHMGRLLLAGSGAAAFLDRLLTRRVLDMKPGQVRYALVCNEQGGVLDDVLVYRVSEEQADYQLVVNAGNRQKIVAWLEAQREGFDVRIIDRTTRTAMIAVQGPQAVELVSALADVDLAAMKNYTGALARVGAEPCTLSRTGYTGEDGCELIVSAQAAESLWIELAERAAKVGGQPAGLAARDTLRLEAGMPLYGHELTEEINAAQAGLDFAVNLKDRDFIGREAILRFREDPRPPRRIGLTLAGRRVAREGHPIVQQGRPVGRVTSGTFSPTLNRPIAMGYVSPEAADPGCDLAIDIRGHLEPAVVVPLPFYKRTS